MFIIDWVASFSPAERDAIRTVSLAIGSGFIPVIGFIVTWMWRVTRKLTREAVDNTRTADFVDGKLVSTTVAELARRAMHNTQDLHREFRSEITDLVNDPRSMPEQRHGRRRDTPTNPISFNTGTVNTGESNYE